MHKVYGVYGKFTGSAHFPVFRSGHVANSRRFMLWAVMVNAGNVQNIITVQNVTSKRPPLACSL